MTRHQWRAYYRYAESAVNGTGPHRLSISRHQPIDQPRAESIQTHNHAAEHVGDDFVAAGADGADCGSGDRGRGDAGLFWPARFAAAIDDVLEEFGLRRAGADHQQIDADR